MRKINDDLPLDVLTALAEGYGFSVALSRPPDADEWVLTAGQGAKLVQHRGTRQSVCAFLTGYAAMLLQTTQILNEIDNGHRRIILGMRERLARLGPL